MSPAVRVASAVRRRWHELPQVVRDGLVPAVLAVGSFVPGIAHNGLALGEPTGRGWDLLAVVLIALQSLPLVLWRRRPVAVLAVVGLAFAAFQCLGYRPAFAGLGLLVAIFLTAVRGGPHRRRTVLVGVAAYVVLAVVLHVLGSSDRVVDLVAFLVVLAVPWWAGTWWRQRVDAEEGRRALEAERAVAAERRRIARDLHDVVTHHVTAMVVQADAGEVVAAAVEGGSRERLTTAFADIGDSGRRALADLRGLLALLSDGAQAPPERQPHLVGVRELVDQARRAGQRVRLEDRIAPDLLGSLSAHTQLAAYRVVQEGLTNARKHAAGKTVTVVLVADETVVEVTVVNPLPAARPAPSVPGAGRGLAGLRERVELAGGTFEAVVDAAAYTLRARIPAGAGS